MNDIYFTEDHEYIIVEDGIGTIGISEYAQGQLGDIVFVELPEIGTVLDQKDECAVIESVKIASEIYSPISGEIIEVNSALDDNPALINEDAIGNGWICKIKITDENELEDLQNENDYEEFLKDQA